MAGIKFLSENYTDSASYSLTTGTADAQFPISNLTDDSPAVKFRSTGNTAVIEIDLLQTRNIDSVAIAGDSTDTFGLTAASYKLSGSTDFSGSPVNVITLSPTESIGLSSITEVSFRYVEITLTGTGSYAELGKVFVGKAINLTQNNISVGSFSYARTDRSNVSQNNHGQKFIDSLNKVKTLGGTIEHCTKDEQEELDDMFLFHGKSKPLWMLIDDASSAINSGQFKLTVYGYLPDIPAWSASGGQLYSASVEVSQAV